MIKTIQEQGELKTPTSVSTFLNLDAADFQKSVEEHNILRFTIFADREPVHLVPEGFRDVGDIVAEAEQNDQDRSALAEARRILAERFYSSENSIRTLRLKAGLSQKALGERMGTSQSHIARIESNGSSVEIRTAASLARALDIDLCAVVSALAGAR